MIPLESIQETYLRMSYYCINQLVNLRNGEGILQADFIQIHEIHTYTSFPIFLLYYHGISQPLGVKDFLDCPCLLKLVHFNLYCLSMFL